MTVSVPNVTEYEYSIMSIVITVSVTALFMCILPVSRFGLLVKVFVQMGIFLGLLLISVNGLNLASYIQALLGELSVASLFIALIVLAEKSSGNILLASQQRSGFYGFLFLTGLLLYPMALGLGNYDPYRLGYQPVLLSLLGILISVVALYARNALLSCYLILVATFYLLSLFASNNLWDYLIDPWIFLYSFFAAIYYWHKPKKEPKSMTGFV